MRTLAVGDTQTEYAFRHMKMCARLSGMPGQRS